MARALYSPVSYPTLTERGRDAGVWATADESPGVLRDLVVSGKIGVAQLVLLPGDTLTEFEIRLSRSPTPNLKFGSVSLSRVDGETLHAERINPANVDVHGAYRLSITHPLRFSPGEPLLLTLACVDVGEKHSFSVCMAPATSGRVGHVKGSSAPARLAVKLNQYFAGGLGARLPGTLIIKATVQESHTQWVYPALPLPPETPEDQQIIGIYDANLALQGAAATRHVFFHAVNEAMSAIASGSISMLVITDREGMEDPRRLQRTCAKSAVPMVYWLRPDAPSLNQPAPPSFSGLLPDMRSAAARALRITALRNCDFVLASRPDLIDEVRSHRKRCFTLPGSSGNSGLPEKEDPVWSDLLAAFRLRRRPLVSIIGILYRKSSEIAPVLASYIAQDYAGDIEILLVDDCSPDDDAGVAQAYFDQNASTRTVGGISLRLLRNERNAGNCFSRNRGVAAARGDVLVIIDADCVVNPGFVSAHVAAHAFDDCEAVIGPMNLETLGREPRAVLAEYASSGALATSHAALQDKNNLHSFLNCVTRNFSIKRTALLEPLFDPAFGYSADPASGYGWEDVELGFRLYQSGARVKFASNAISVHVSPPESDRLDPEKPLRSMRNFRRLLEKHEELALVAREWALETFASIEAWADSQSSPHDENRGYLRSLLRGVKRTSTHAQRTHRRYRVLTYRWHVPHQYELYKLGFDFTLATGTGTGLCDSWEYGQRPLPANARLVPFSQVNPSDYDFAILHFDENVLAPENTHGVIGKDWGATFHWFMELSLPKVAVCHGTPQFHGQFDIQYGGANLMKPIEAERVRLVDFVGGMPIIVNSHQAAAEWGFKNSRVIWHGLDPADFPPATYERGILSPMGPLVTSRPHYRGYFLYREVFGDLSEPLMPESLKVPEPHPLYESNLYALAKYRNYVEEIRRYSVYFNPTIRSPMPRARTEPMMCGVVPVSARNHDVEMFIRNGVNGFYGESADELRDQLRYLLTHPADLMRIGSAARRTACTTFNLDRFLGDWRKVVSDVLA